MRPQSKEILLDLIPLIISIYCVLILMLNIVSPILVASAVLGIVMTIFTPIFNESKNTIRNNLKEIYKRLNDATITYQGNNDISERLEKMVKDLDMYKQYYKYILLFFVLEYAAFAALFTIFINAEYILPTTFLIEAIIFISFIILFFTLIFWNAAKLQNMEKIIEEVIIKEKDNLIDLIKRYYKSNFTFKIWKGNR